MDKLGQMLQGILDSEAVSLIVGPSRPVVSSNPDNFLTICVQDYKPTHSMPFLGSAIKLHMHHFARNKVCF